MLSIPMFCLVTNYHSYTLDAYLEFLEQTIAGGVNCIQLRDKFNPKSKVMEWALAIQSFLKTRPVSFIVNDSVDLAQAIKADGVHLGNTDSCPRLARKKLGPNSVIGVSIESQSDLQSANTLQCIDYVAASAVFATSSKQNCKTIWGLEGLKHVAQNSVHPVVAIGGINTLNAFQVMQQGAKGIAVISALHDVTNPLLMSRKLNQLIKQDIHEEV